MKHRDIFRVPARIERRSRIAEAHKVAGEAVSTNEDLGWFIVVDLGGKEFAFHHGDDKIILGNSTIALILEYTVPDNE